MPAIIGKPHSAARAWQEAGLHCRVSWPAYFRLMVVFTPWLVVLSSNQRAVMVLVWV
jgi:hypothetical protein